MKENKIRLQKHLSACGVASRRKAEELIEAGKVRVNGDARGKQSDKRGGIWYTPQSGIWQTVWLEFMPKSSIERIKITPDITACKVDVSFDCDEEVCVRVFDESTEILCLTGKNSVTLSYPFTLWSPENPKLYDIILTNPSGDEVRSYFGVRSFSIVTDKNGKKRLGLNGKPYFYNGVLDQGYWSDGLLTYPCDEAVVNELTLQTTALVKRNQAIQSLLEELEKQKETLGERYPNKPTSAPKN